MTLRIGTILLVLVLSACSAAPDSEQIRLCRVIVPALHPDTTHIRDIRFVPSGRAEIRIEYWAREPGAATGRNRFVTCTFGGAGLSPRRNDLTAVVTDDGPLGIARLFFLKRNWLPIAPGRFDAGPSAAEAVVSLPAASAYAAQQLIAGLTGCVIYALLATAYSLIYGLIGRINLAFGEMAVIGAYGAIATVGVALAGGLERPETVLGLALLVATGAGALWSTVVGRLVVAPLHGHRRHGQSILVATIAVAITLQEMLRLLQGPGERWLSPVYNQPVAVARAGSFVVTVTPMQVTVIIMGLCAAILVLGLLARTRFGRSWRAFADDPHTAALFGVNPARILAMTFALAGLLAGLAGWIVAAYYGNVSFAMGLTLGLKALVAAVVGGIGSVPGAFLGGVLIGLIEAFWSAYFDIAQRDIVVFSLLVVVFILRPGGLLGLAGPRPREI